MKKILKSNNSLRIILLENEPLINVSVAIVHGSCKKMPTPQFQSDAKLFFSLHSIHQPGAGSWVQRTQFISPHIL